MLAERSSPVNPTNPEEPKKPDEPSADARSQPDYEAMAARVSAEQAAIRQGESASQPENPPVQPAAQEPSTPAVPPTPSQPELTIPPVVHTAPVNEPAPSPPGSPTDPTKSEIQPPIQEVSEYRPDEFQKVYEEFQRTLEQARQTGAPEEVVNQARQDFYHATRDHFEAIGRKMANGETLSPAETEVFYQHQAEEIINNQWQKSQHELLMEQKYGRKGGLLGWRNVFHGMRRYFAGESKRFGSEFFGKHKSKIKLVGGTSGVALGVLIGSPAALAIGAAYATRGLVESIKKGIWTERREKETGLSLNEKLRLGEAALHGYAQLLAQEVAQVETAEAKNEAIAKLIEAKSLITSHGLELHFYKVGDQNHVLASKPGEMPTDLPPGAEKVSQSVKFSALLERSIKIERRAGLLESWAGLAAAGLAGYASVIAGMREAGATTAGIRPAEGLTDVKGFLKSVSSAKKWLLNIKHDPSPMADYHRTAQGIGNLWKFFFTTAEKIQGIGKGAHALNLEDSRIAQTSINLIGSALNAMKGLFVVSVVELANRPDLKATQAQVAKEIDRLNRLSTQVQKYGERYKPAVPPPPPTEERWTRQQLEKLAEEKGVAIPEGPSDLPKEWRGDVDKLKKYFLIDEKGEIKADKLPEWHKVDANGKPMLDRDGGPILARVIKVDLDRNRIDIVKKLRVKKTGEIFFEHQRSTLNQFLSQYRPRIRKALPGEEAPPEAPPTEPTQKPTELQRGTLEKKVEQLKQELVSQEITVNFTQARRRDGSIIAQPQRHTHAGEQLRIRPADWMPYNQRAQTETNFQETLVVEEVVVETRKDGTKEIVLKVKPRPSS